MAESEASDQADNSLLRTFVSKDVWTEVTLWDTVTRYSLHSEMVSVLCLFAVLSVLGFLLGDRLHERRVTMREWGDE